MESLELDWASFFNDSITVFSKEFQSEMTFQLKKRFDLMVGIENFADENNFQLFIGMTPLKLSYQDGYGFGLVEIIDKYSFSKILTFYWKSTTVTNEEVINSKKINFENIEFGWCADFDKEYFLRIENNKIVHDIQSKVLGFKYVANFDLFPDLSFHFELEIKPSQSIIEDLNRLMMNNFKKSYVSDISGENLQLHAIVDFQDTTIDDGITEINQFIMDYKLSSLKEITKSISIN